MATSLLKKLFGSKDQQIDWSVYIRKAIHEGQPKKVSYGLDRQDKFNSNDINVAISTINNFYQTNYHQGQRQGLNELSASRRCIQWYATVYPKETWAFLTTPAKYNKIMPIHELLGSRIATTRDVAVSAEQDAVVLTLQKLAEEQHDWTKESELPKEKQFLHKLVSRQTTDNYSSVAMPADSLGHWIRKFNLKPIGWEGEFVMHMAHRRNFHTRDDIMSIFDLANMDVTALTDGPKGSALEGTSGNNALHMIALGDRSINREFIDYLHDKGFKDHPNSAGLYGTQAIIKYNNDLNVKHTAKLLFGLQLPPLTPDIDYVPNPLQKLINARVAVDDLKAVKVLQYAERFGTDNNYLLIDDKSLSLYAFSVNDSALLRMAFTIGDVPASFNTKPADTMLYKALKLWGLDPMKYQAVTKELMEHLNKPDAAPHNIEVLHAVTAKYPDYDWGVLPIDSNSVLMEEMKSISPTLYDRLISSRQLQLDI